MIKIDSLKNENIIEENNNTDNNFVISVMIKNRTMQFYKFLFYSIKLEIKNTELINLLRISNTSEILLYILSIILLCVANFKNDFFVIFHSFHFIKVIVGFFLLFKLVQSSDIVKAMASSENKEDLEMKLFNDYERKIIYKEI